MGRFKVVVVLGFVVVIAVNVLMTYAILPRMDAAFLAEPQWGSTSLPAVAGLWSVIVALPVVIVYVFLQRHFIRGMLAGAVKG